MDKFLTLCAKHFYRFECGSVDCIMRVDMTAAKFELTELMRLHASLKI